jgi:hypothetical protein
VWFVVYIVAVAFVLSILPQEIGCILFVASISCIAIHSIRQYCSGKGSKPRIFSIGQLAAESVYECDFRLAAGEFDQSVVVDLDDRFDGRQLGITEAMAIKPNIS